MHSTSIGRDYIVYNYQFWAYMTYFYTSALVVVFGLFFGGNLGGPQRDPNYQAQIRDGIPRTWSAPALLGIAAASALAFGQI